MTQNVSPQEALIYVMVTMSAVDRSMTDAELARIGEIVSQMPVFDDFDKDKLTLVAQACGELLGADGGLELEWTLPNGVVFGSNVTPGRKDVALELWLRNGTEATLTGLRTQICAMLKGAAGFTAQTADNKTLEPPVAAAHMIAFSIDSRVIRSFAIWPRLITNTRCETAAMNSRFCSTESKPYSENFCAM